MMAELSRFALNHSIKGFEGLEGIPGTIGGAVFMNAGAYGYEIKDVISSIELIDENGDLQILSANDLGLQYRNSNLREGKLKGIVTKCFFNIKMGIQDEIESKMELFHYKRHKYQDFLYPNLGSMFSGSIYRELGKGDKVFKFISSLYFLLNYEFKIFRRESPINRKWINDIIVRRFNLIYDKQPFSNKSINCLVNRGQGTDEMLRYITQINELTKHKVPIENEIVEEF
jgi:UDP-N-acetylmuramate dehydrogenase